MWKSDGGSCEWMGCGPSSYCPQSSVHLLQDGWSAQLLIFLCGPDFQWMLMYETEIFMFCALLSVVLPPPPKCLYQIFLSETFQTFSLPTPDCSGI